jgi:hypothetical protein
MTRHHVTLTDPFTVGALTMGVPAPIVPVTRIVSWTTGPPFGCRCSSVATRAACEANAPDSDGCCQVIRVMPVAVVFPLGLD